MSSVNARTKKAWEESQKEHALRFLELLMEKIVRGDLKLVSHGINPSGDFGDGTYTFFVDVKDWNS